MEINSSSNNYPEKIPQYKEAQMVYGIYVPKDSDSEDEFVPKAMAVYGIATPNEEDQQEQKTGFLDKIKNFFSGNKEEN